MVKFTIYKYTYQQTEAVDGLHVQDSGVVWEFEQLNGAANLSPQYNCQFHTQAVNLILVSHEHLAWANWKSPVITTHIMNYLHDQSNTKFNKVLTF